jgi:hypothetical protein
MDTLLRIQDQRLPDDARHQGVAARLVTLASGFARRRRRWQAMTKANLRSAQRG